MDYVIRIATPADAPALYGISIRSHTASYYDTFIPEHAKSDFYMFYSHSDEREAKFTDLMARKIANPAWRVAVAEYGGEIVGYTLAHLKVEGKLMLRGLFVDPSVHSKGIGTALFDLSLMWARPGDEIELAVIEKNSVARRIYEKHDFVIVDSKSEDFFGAKMVVMRKFEH